MKKWLVGTLCVIALTMVGIPNFCRARDRGLLKSCQSNLKNLATALEMYSTDNVGRYPEELALLTPRYLKLIPACPSESSPYGYTSEL